VDLWATVVPPPIRVITLPACDVDYTRAVLWGLLAYCKPPSMANVSFGWDTSHKDDPAGYANWISAKKLLFGLLYYSEVSSLQPGTTYYFRARAKADSYYAYGEELKFTTPPDLQVITLPARDIETKQATLYGKTVGRYRSSKVQASFGWDTTSHAGDPGGYNWTPWQNVWVGDTFSAKITKLTPNTNYYYRARVARGGVVSYGEELTFKTPPEKKGPWSWWDWLCGW
jgi:phosphodiesterase/alkaline phosphatase D-like protein